MSLSEKVREYLTEGRKITVNTQKWLEKIIVIVSKSKNPMYASEIAEQMSLHGGFPNKTVTPNQTVSNILSNHPEIFIKAKHYDDLKHEYIFNGYSINPKYKGK